MIEKGNRKLECFLNREKFRIRNQEAGELLFVTNTMRTGSWHLDALWDVWLSDKDGGVGTTKEQGIQKE